MPVNLYEVLWIFVIYAFAGWCTEVAYAGLNKGVFVNRGFLNGPYCPLYGFGVLIVVVMLTPLKGNMLVLFLGSVLLTSILEYFTGLILEKVFGNKWWDYSNIPFNIQGYVCLKFSIFWGLGCMFIMNTVHPGVYKVIQWIPKKLGTFLLAIIMIAFAIDVCVTVNTILKFNRKMRMLEDVAARMRKLSDEIGEDIFEKVTDIAEKAEEVEEYLEEKRDDAQGYLEEKRADAQEYLEEKRADVQEAKEKLDDAKLKLMEAREEYRTMLAEKTFGFHRLTKAFPDMKSKKYDKVLQQYKEYLEMINQKK